MKLRLRSPDVYAAEQPVGIFGEEERHFLLERLPHSRLGRVRINMHADDTSTLHEMFIALAGGSYVRPHRHCRKSESFHLVQGELDVVLFHENGAVLRSVRLGADGICFYRLSESLFHMVIPRSEAVILHEVTDGPFDPELTVHAPFAPGYGDAEAVARYLSGLETVLHQESHRHA